ncbi:hypothetical protein AB5I41_19265 [Sphingomonas sp. MMS24-JH45]
MRAHVASGAAKRHPERGTCRIVEQPCAIQDFRRPASPRRLLVRSPRRQRCVADRHRRLYRRAERHRTRTGRTGTRRRHRHARTREGRGGCGEWIRGGGRGRHRGEARRRRRDARHGLGARPRRQGEIPGSVAAEGLRFTREGKDEILVPSDGDATGLKWLAGKKDCLTVKSGEGYCRA